MSNDESYLINSDEAGSGNEPQTGILAGGTTSPSEIRSPTLSAVCNGFECGDEIDDHHLEDDESSAIRAKIVLSVVIVMFACIS